MTHTTRCSPMRLYIAITVAILLLNDLQARDPKPFESKEGKYKVVFPGEPEVTTKKTEGNEKLHMASYSPQGGGGFFVIYSDLKGDKIKDSKPREILESGKEGLVKNVGAEIKKSREIEWQKYPALRIEGEAKLPGENTKIHLNMTIILTRENRLYQVFVFGPKDFVSSKQVDKFFDSFQITK
jgi:hypothetical protein